MRANGKRSEVLSNETCSDVPAAAEKQKSLQNSGVRRASELTVVCCNLKAAASTDPLIVDWKASIGKPFVSPKQSAVGRNI